MIYVEEEDSEDIPLLNGKNGNRQSEDNGYSKCGAFLIFIFPALGGLLFGYDIGGSNNVTPKNSI